MKVRIVCYEDTWAWILGKFALKLRDGIAALGHTADIAKKTDRSADINHHIIYYDYDGRSNGLDTVMITHIDTVDKLNKIKFQLNSARLGICMSNGTVKQLQCSGVPRDRLAYVNPAHDSVIRPRKLNIGILSKTHADGRKKENELLEIASKIPARDFKFVIMGAGWHSVVDQLLAQGFEVEYHDQFDYSKYVSIVPTLDYFLYYSFDEGSMAFLDALSAGVKTIVSPQGYHLDAVDGIVFPVWSVAEVVKSLQTESAKRNKLISSVADWTWENYAKKHVDIWSELLGEKTACHFPTASDGVRSLQSRNSLIDLYFKVLSRGYIRKHY